MTLHDKIKQTLREYHLDPVYGKRPDALADKLEQLFQKELRAANVHYGRPKLVATSRSLATSSRLPQKRLASVHDR